MSYVSVSSHLHLWRYLTQEKLTWLLNDKRLYLPRSSKFEDTWEGHFPRQEERDYKNGLVDDLRRMGLLHDQSDADMEKALLLLDRSDLWSGRTQYVSCWHINEGESAAMWDLYCSRKDGIAIRTSGRILNAIADSIEHAVFAKVEYLDYDRDSILKENRDPLFCKRLSFEHENEARLVLPFALERVDEKNVAPKEAVTVDIDPSTFIEEVIIAPDASPELIERVTTLLRGAGVQCEIKRSTLYARY